MWPNSKHLIGLLIVTFLSYGLTVEGKKFMRCELTRELLQRYQINKTFLSNWICMVEHESNLDTKKVVGKPNGTTSYGLFQINSKDYCRPDRKGGLCNKKCEDFINDNIDDDVACAKMILEQQGFKYWQGWNVSCRNRNNLPNLSISCNINSLAALQTYYNYYRMPSRNQRMRY